MKLIAMKGDITDEILLAMIYKNVPSVVQAKLSIIRQESGLTWNQVYYMAKVYDETPKNNTADIENYQSYYKNPQKSKSKQYKNQNSNNPHPIKKKKYCKFHKSHGHWTSECREVERANEITVDKEESVEEDYARGKNDNINKNIFNYSTYAVSNKLPTITLEIEGKKIEALIDTGSEANFIRNLRALSNRITKCNSKVKAANNSRIHILGKITGVNTRIQNENFAIDFIVTDHIGKQCILGMPFILDYIKSFSIENGEPKVIWNTKSIYALLAPLPKGEILKRFPNIFINEPHMLAGINIGEHIISTYNADPIKAPIYRLGTKTEELIEEEVAKLLKAKIIRKSTSPWRAPVVATIKKNGDLRMCIDYRKLNSVTIKDAYPMPNIDEIFDSLYGATIFSTLDCYSGYYQVKIRESDIPKTAFSCRSGSYEFMKMPFGLVNGPATFQRCIDEILREEKWKFVSVYLDDVIIYSKTVEEHQEHVTKILEKLEMSNIKLNRDKCKFFQEEVKILGHKISKHGISPDEDRVKSIKEFRLPKNKKELQSFLGLVSYCRKFIKNLSETATPLYQALKENQGNIKEFTLNEEAKSAYENIKKKINHDIILKLPDTNKEFILTTDASNVAIGAALVQTDENNVEHIISFFSKILNPAQKNYSTTDKELLAIVEAIKHFRPYLTSNKFTVRTDHKPISYLLTSKNLSSRLMRWSLLLQEYNMNIEYLKGKNNYIDSVSRLVSEDDTKSVTSNIEIYEIGCTKIIKHPTTQFILPPEEARNDILREYHNITGHGGTRTMKYHIMRKYHWPGLNTQINKFCAGCSTCNAAKPPTKSRELISIKTTAPHETWHCDLVGPLETTKNGNRYILTIIDNFSKQAKAFPLPDKRPIQIARYLKKR
ncbi:MAG: reverse transcriptase domain-containing protein [Aeromonas sp.]